MKRRLTDFNEDLNSILNIKYFISYWSPESTGATSSLVSDFHIRYFVTSCLLYPRARHPFIKCVL